MADERDPYKALLDDLYDGVFLVDRDCRITYWNKGAERITGIPAERVIGRSCSDTPLRHVDAQGADMCLASCPLAEAMADGHVRELDVFLHHANGHRVPVLVKITPLRDGEGGIVGGVEIFSDNAAVIAGHRQVAQAGQAPALDPLTGVGDRGFIESRIETALVASYGRSPALGVLLVDLDRFKYVNERHGREAGDRALKAVALTLRQGIRSTDVVGRWGADEFVVAVVGVDRTRVIMIANKLRAAVERTSVPLGRGESRVTVSIGATLARPGDTLETLMKRAAALLSQSRISGRDVVTFGE